MDDLEGRRDVKPDQRIDQFMRLREVIEERAGARFFCSAYISDFLALGSKNFSRYILRLPLNTRYLACVRGLKIIRRKY